MVERAPFFSVITVVRNGMPHIAQAMQSVLMQSGVEYEYIVIDGDSTDGTREFVMSHADRLAGWSSEPDQGIADAFNKGLAKSRGEYVLFLNADDALADSHVLQRVAEIIRTQNYPDLLYGDYRILQRDNGQPMYDGRVEYDAAKLRLGQVLPHPCLFTRRSYFEKYGSFDTTFRIAMDYEWMLRGIKNVRLLHIPEVTTLIRDGGISTQNRAQVVGEIIRAQKKHGMIKGRVAETGMHIYFTARAIMRRVLKATGLYSIRHSGNVK